MHTRTLDTHTDYDTVQADEMEDVAKLHSLALTFVQPSDDTTPPAGGGSHGRGAGAGAGTSAGTPTVPDTGEVFPCTGVSWSATGSVLFASYVPCAVSCRGLGLHSLSLLSLLLLSLLP